MGLGSLLSTNAIDEQATINNNFENSFKDYKPVLFIAVFITSIFAFIGVGLVLGFTMNRFQLNFSIFNLLMLPNEITVDRYLEILNFPIYIKFSGIGYFRFPVGGAGISIGSEDTRIIFVFFTIDYCNSLRFDGNQPIYHHYDRCDLVCRSFRR